MIKNGASNDICLTDIQTNSLTMLQIFIHTGSSMPCGTGFLIKSPEELQHNILNAASDVYQFAGLVYEVGFNSLPQKVQ